MMENPHLEFLPPGARNDPSAEFPPLLYILNHTSGREYWVYEINESGADISSQEWAVSGMARWRNCIAMAVSQHSRITA
jgi:hypothetical protein